jgi:hypothetical protein
MILVTKPALGPDMDPVKGRDEQFTDLGVFERAVLPQKLVGPESDKLLPS